VASQVCAPWIDTDDLCCEGAGPDVVACDGTASPLVYKWTDDDFVLAASNILFARTCFLYPGVCTDTAWPCICACCQ